MTFKEFKKALFDRPDDMEERLYDYGYECGERNVINFEVVQQVFYIFNYSETERLKYMRCILKGFRDGASTGDHLI